MEKPVSVARKWLLLSAIASGCFGSLSPAAGIADDSTPRYRLKVGQELVYDGDSEWKYDNGKFLDHDSWRIWVVRENPEGGWRLVIRYSNNSRHVRMDEQHDAEGNEPQRATENVTLAWCDFSADGVIVENESFGFRMTPATLFP